MTRFRIARNDRNPDRELLRARIEGTLVADVSLLVKWSNRDKSDIVSELLRYALSQESEFQAYKATRQSAPTVEPTAPGTSTGETAASLESRASRVAPLTSIKPN
jgi:hypothetical protein